MRVNVSDIVAGKTPFSAILQDIWTDLDELKIRMSDVEASKPSPPSLESLYAQMESNSSHHAQERAYLEERIIDLEDILGEIYFYIHWRYVTKQLTTPQKELFAQSVEHSSVRLDPSIYPSLEVDRWWLD